MGKTRARTAAVSASGEEAILTLEPLIEAVRAAIERLGWELSGLQKTTSHQFEGRWEGESTRSAYLFFHSTVPGIAEHASIDVYLDETTKGLTGNMALVVDLAPLGILGDATETLERLSALSVASLSTRRRRPLTLRFRLDDAGTEISRAESEVRFKIAIPRSLIGRGGTAVGSLAEEAVRGFEEILASAELARFADGA
jgi:hypothetical protein